MDRAPLELDLRDYPYQGIYTVGVVAPARFAKQIELHGELTFQRNSEQGPFA